MVDKIITAFNLVILLAYEAAKLHYSEALVENASDLRDIFVHAAGGAFPKGLKIETTNYPPLELPTDVHWSVFAVAASDKELIIEFNQKLSELNAFFKEKGLDMHFKLIRGGRGYESPP